MKGITKLYRWIPWEVVADTLGSVEHILGTRSEWVEEWPAS